MEDLIDYLPYYPSIKDKSFSYNLFRLKEVNELTLGPSEAIPTTPDTPLRSQALEQRVFNPHTDYQGEVVFHGMGSGKTCTSEFIIDAFKTYPNNRHVLIISPSDVLQTSFASDIAKKCATEKFQVVYVGDAYDKVKDKAKQACATKGTKSEVDECVSSFIKTSQSKASIKKVKKTYEMKTISDLKKIIDKAKADEDIIKTYSHAIIVIDEAHLIRKDKAGGYDAIRKFLRMLTNKRVFLLTGTPIWDKVEDIASLFNLILPDGEQLKTGAAFLKEYLSGDELKPEAIPILKKAFKGRVSFLREMLSSATRKYIGVTSPWLKHMTIFPVAMSAYQIETIESILEAGQEINPKNVKQVGYENWTVSDFNEYAMEEKGLKAKLIKPSMTEKERKKIYRSFRFSTMDSGFQIDARESTAFSAPDYEIKNGKVKASDKVLYGTDFFKKAVVYHSKKNKWDYKDKLYLKFILESLEIYANKLSFIVSHIISHENEVGWIYDKSVATGAGVINYAILLNNMKDAEGQRMFKWARTLEEVKAPSEIPKFIVISSQEGTFRSATEINKVLEFVGSRENRYGQYCRFVFGTKKASLGLTLKNARWAIVSTLHWNESEVDQALARIYRVGSHENFDKPEERYVNIYLLASVKKAAPKTESYNKGKGFPKNAAFSKDETVDIIISKTAEAKDYTSAQIYRLAKEASWNCAVAYGRNVLEHDIPFSRFAGYGDINYLCDDYPDKTYVDELGKTQHTIDRSGVVWKYNVPPNEIVKSNYNLFYSVDPTLQNSLKELFRNYGCLELSSIKILVSDDEIKLLGTLKHMISTHVTILDRYGFTRYLEEDRNVYFLKNTRAKQYYTDCFYTKYPLINEPLSLQDVVESKQLASDLTVIRNMCGSKMSLAEIASKIETLNYKTKVFVIEELAVNNLKKALAAFPKYLKQAESFVWHDLYLVEPKGIKYVKKEKNQLRILEMGVWRYAYKGWELDQIRDTKVVPLAIVKKKSENAGSVGMFDKEKAEKVGYQAFMRDGVFRIKELPGKPQTQGMVCATSWENAKLYELIYKLGMYKTLPTVMPKDPKEERRILRLKVNSKQRYIYGGNPANIDLPLGTPGAFTDNEVAVLNEILDMKGKNLVCDFVQKWFEKENLIEVV